MEHIRKDVVIAVVAATLVSKVPYGKYPLGWWGAQWSEPVHLAPWGARL